MAIKVQPQQTTTYTCKITIGDKTYADSVRIRVNTSGRPVVTNNCLTLTTGRSSRYQWNRDQQPVPGATDSVFTPGQPGDYSVSVIDAKGRSSTSLPFTISKKVADSIEALNAATVIQPDPATYKVKILSPSKVNMIVTDENGRMVTRQSPAQEWDMNNVPDGTYTVMLFNDNCITFKRRKLVKKTE